MRGADRRLEIQRAAMFFGGLGQPQSVLGDQRLVGGDHRFAGFQRRLDRRQRGIAGAAHQFDEAIDAGIVGQRQRALGPFDAAQVDAALLHLRARGDRDDAHAASAARRQHPALLFDEADDFGANSAEPRNTHFQGCDHEMKKPAEVRLPPVGERNHVVQRFKAAFKEAAHAARGLADPLLVFHHGDADIALAVLAEGHAGRYHHARFLDHQGRELHAADVANAFGSGAQANIEACGGGMSHPARPKDSTSASRRLR